MKEWALKHPVMTFLLASAAVDGVVKIVKLVSLVLVTGRIPAQEEAEEATEEAAKDESGNDIQ